MDVSKLQHTFWKDQQGTRKNRNPGAARIKNELKYKKPQRQLDLSPADYAKAWTHMHKLTPKVSSAIDEGVQKSRQPMYTPKTI